MVGKPDYKGILTSCACASVDVPVEIYAALLVDGRIFEVIGLHLNESIDESKLLCLRELSTNALFNADAYVLTDLVDSGYVEMTESEMETFAWALRYF